MSTCSTVHPAARDDPDDTGPLPAGRTRVRPTGDANPRGTRVTPRRGGGTEVARSRIGHGTAWARPAGCQGPGTGRRGARPRWSRRGCESRMEEVQQRPEGRRPAARTRRDGRPMALDDDDMTSTEGHGPADGG